MGQMKAILEYRVVERGPGVPKIHTLEGEIAGQVWAENLAAVLRVGPFGSDVAVECRIYGSAEEWRPAG